jgi:Aspartyl protease
MVCRVVVLAAFFAVFASAAAAAPDSRAWPAAYEATSLTVPDLLAKANAAAGAPDARTLRLTYELREGNLTGVERRMRRGTDYRIDKKIGPFVTASGRFHGQRWELGENGYTLLRSGSGEPDDGGPRVPRAAPPEAVTTLGRLPPPIDAYVVRVAPPGGRPQLRFYDASTFRLVRVETPYRDGLVVTTFGDFRSVDGHALPYVTTTSDGHSETDIVATLRDVAYGDPIADAQLEIPLGSRLPVSFPADTRTVRLPARITRMGAVIVRVDINGRGLDFQLDTGSHGLVIDRDVATQLGLPIYRQWTQTVAGTFTAGETIIPRMQIGPLAMTDIAVDVMPVGWTGPQRTEVVGLLGFDFLAGALFKIDYQNGTVDAMPYDTPFPPEAFALNAELDGGVPTIPVGINGVLSRRFIVDTGAWDVLVFSRFAAEHPGLVKDHAVGREMSLTTLRPFDPLPFRSAGIGGDLHTRALVLERMQIGRIGFDNFLAELMYGDQPSFEGGADGLVGASVLSAFDLYLDYGNARIGFALNDSGKHHKPARGLGTPAR